MSNSNHDFNNNSDYMKTKYNPRDPDILTKIVQGFGSKIVGEENNIKILMLAGISKDLPKKNRISIIITSQSSAGKSNLLNTVLELFKEDVIDFTEFTPAFLNRQEFDMNGKIFKLEQMEKTNDKNQVTLSNIKFLLTEGKIRMGLVEKNDKGKNTPTTLEVRGFPVFFSTSTNYNIDPESINRTLLMQVDESELQTGKIVSHILDSYANLIINDSWQVELEDLTKLAQAYKYLAKHTRDIAIPFGKKLEKQIPISEITIRRDLPKILNLTCVIAFIHASNRIKIQDTKGEHFITDNFGETEKQYTYAIVAEPSDFKEALDIAGTTIQQTLNKINKSSMDIYEKFLEVYRQKLEDNSISGQNMTLDGQSNEVGVTIKEVSKVTKLSHNRTRELVNQLYNAGFFLRERTKTREFVYYPTGKKFENIKIEDLTFSKDELDEWLKEQIGTNKERLEIVHPQNRNFMSFG